MAEIVVVLEFALALQKSPQSNRVGEFGSDGAQYSTALELVYGVDQIKPLEMNRTRITFSRKVSQILSAPIRVFSAHSNFKNSSYNRVRNRGVDNRVRLNNIDILPEPSDRMRLNRIGLLPQEKGLIMTANMKRFSLAELRSTTRGFSPDMMLAEGNFGKVFMGWLDEDTLAPMSIGIGMAVAIKRFNPDEKLKAMQTEVDLCGRFYHPNLVKLLGVCSEGREFLIVYECAPKGSLERYAYKDNGKSLSWVIWFKILIGAARYLAFLHSSDDHIIFCDFRLANILLDGDFNPKIFDSGRARCGSADGDTLMTGIPYLSAQYCAVSEGYLSPEYKEDGRLSSKNDVYAFGVVMLEILTGMRVVDVNRRNKKNLVDKARPILACERKFKTVVNPKLLEQRYCPKGVDSILSDVPALALRCLDLDPKKRPSMRKVVEILEEIHANIK
ncbi:receptor-like cytoplasmic kinase 176 [Heracleum sosnowskyi]|uniref:Receptor-like cytoplasmic kinase 176 n=1 Tax=Heracleum sosnowskyi TaxID=360622 RepID=A0AAD8I7U3_9APIA|nr:receptor-like cytoplasmic kinase 176 [Heracleum sosnowskyi]